MTDINLFELPEDEREAYLLAQEHLDAQAALLPELEPRAEELEAEYARRDTEQSELKEQIAALCEKKRSEIEDASLKQLEERHAIEEKALWQLFMVTHNTRARVDSIRLRLKWGVGHLAQSIMSSRLDDENRKLNDATPAPGVTPEEVEEALFPTRIEDMDSEAQLARRNELLIAAPVLEENLYAFLTGRELVRIAVAHNTGKKRLAARVFLNAKTGAVLEIDHRLSPTINPYLRTASAPKGELGEFTLSGEEPKLGVTMFTMLFTRKSEKECLRLLLTSIDFPHPNSMKPEFKEVLIRAFEAARVERESETEAEQRIEA